MKLEALTNRSTRTAARLSASAGALGFATLPGLITSSSGRRSVSLIADMAAFARAMNEWRFKLLYDGECPFCRRESRWCFDGLYTVFARHRVRVGRFFGRSCASGTCDAAARTRKPKTRA